ncbi:MAG: hypothetical protein K0V04_41460 [Deltaproteobacteria bacterium]|nr:hypothetical protein [Deltaproteobacteria bacterium]
MTPGRYAATSSAGPATRAARFASDASATASSRWAHAAQVARGHRLYRRAIGGMAALHLACAQEQFEIGYITYQAAQIADAYDVVWDAVALSTSRIGCE